MITTPRRIGKLTVLVEMPARGFTEAQKEQLIKIAMTCPVHKSLHPDVQIPIEWRWSKP